MKVLKTRGLFIMNIVTIQKGKVTVSLQLTKTNTKPVLIGLAVGILVVVLLSD
jgi:hypothetical protein